MTEKTWTLVQIRLRAWLSSKVSTLSSTTKARQRLTLLMFQICHGIRHQWALRRRDLSHKVNLLPIATSRLVPLIAQSSWRMIWQAPCVRVVNVALPWRTATSARLWITKRKMESMTSQSGARSASGLVCPRQLVQTRFQASFKVSIRRSASLSIVKSKSKLVSCIAPLIVQLSWAVHRTVSTIKIRIETFHSPLGTKFAWLSSRRKTVLLISSHDWTFKQQDWTQLKKELLDLTYFTNLHKQN